MKCNGTKCNVCIGCGKCFSNSDQMQVVTDSFLLTEEIENRQEDMNIVSSCFMCIDIGTTTIAIECYDEKGKKVSGYATVNPQRVFGKDVLSRISNAENMTLRLQMQSLVKKEISGAIRKFRDEGYEPGSGYVAGNTTMMYLLMGRNPGQLGTAPFRADYLEGEQFSIEDVTIYTLPCFSAFVGGDLMAGALACKMDKNSDNILLIDLGTNGEMLLCAKDRIYGTATAAGPAFEGGDDKNYACDRLKRIAELRKNGMIDENGCLKEPYLEQGIVVGELKVTQDMIQAILVAKAAVRAGIEILVKKAGITMKDISRVYLAGGFGYFLDENSALVAGLLPPEVQGKVKAVGNTSLAGAFLYATCKDSPQKVNVIKEKAFIYNLAEEEEFTEIFVSQMRLE